MRTTLLAVLILIAGCANDPGEDETTLAPEDEDEDEGTGDGSQLLGRVVDRDDRPVECRVELHGLARTPLRTFVPDEKGTFSLGEPLPYGDYRITVLGTGPYDGRVSQHEVRSDELTLGGISPSTLVVRW